MNIQVELIWDKVINMLSVGKQDFRVVGYLDSLDDIKINANNFALIKLTTLTDLPESIDVNDFHGEINVYVSKFNMLSFYDNALDPEDLRVQHIWNELSQLLIEVTPDVKRDSDRPNKYWWWGDQVRVTKRNNDFDPRNPKIKLLSMPVFSTDNSATDIEGEPKFEEALQTVKLVGKLKSDWPKDKFDVPIAVIWKNGETDMSLYTGITQQNHTKYGIMYLMGDNSLKKINLNYEENPVWFRSYYQFQDVIYIPSDIYFEQYLPKAEDVTLTKNIDSEIEINDNQVDEGNNQSISDGRKLSLNANVIEEAKEDTNTELMSKDLELLRRFKESTRQKGLYYADEDLVNFHVSMKTDGMVILSGLSGTGKSKLVTEYANVLKISSGDNGPRSQVRFVSVRPFWADDSDLLGYADTVNNIYRPGDSGLIDTLIDAQDNQDDLFIIVFDEMNLARVEHYFSQFLSVLEMDSGLRTLTLYNPQLEARLYNSEKYPSSISIGENVLFVGTVNTDESTYQFSDKVLDRSNVMTLQMLPFGSITEEVTTSLAKGQTETVKLGDYQKMKKINPDARMSQNDQNMFWDIHQALNEMDSNVGIGWRIVKQIDKYLMNLPQYVDWFDRRQAIDYQVAQRVLTKVRGSEEQLTPLVGTISSDGTYKEGKLGEIFSKNAASSDFLVSRKILQKKAKELKLYGFTV